MIGPRGWAVAVLAAGGLLSPLAPARDCLTRTTGHLFEVGDWLTLGAELRFFYFGISIGQGLPDSSWDGGREFQDNFFLGLKPLLQLTPLDDLTLLVEGDLRYRVPGWEGHAVPGFGPRPAHAFVEYDPGAFRLTAGLQGLDFGTAAVLDQRFVALSGAWRGDWLEIAAFGGATTRDMMRSAANCLWLRYLSDSTGWKYISNELGESWGAGLSADLGLLKPWRLRGLYLFSWPNVERLRSHTFSLSASGPLWSPYLSLVADAVLFISHEQYLLPGLVVLLRSRPWLGPEAPEFELGLANAFGETDERRLAPVFENLSWGILRRFSLNHDHLASLRAAWTLAGFVRPFARYTLQTSDFTDSGSSDELDVGVELSLLDERLWLRLAYVGINLAPAATASHAAYLELRVLAGP